VTVRSVVATGTNIGQGSRHAGRDHDEIGLKTAALSLF
jgi:hypothetical protein